MKIHQLTKSEEEAMQYLYGYQEVILLNMFQMRLQIFFQQNLNLY